MNGSRDKATSGLLGPGRTEPPRNSPGPWRRIVWTFTLDFLETAPLRYLHTAWSELEIMVKLFMVGGDPERAGRG